MLFKPTDAVDNKLTPNRKYGWSFSKVLNPGKLYLIKNIFELSGDGKMVSQGHLYHIHRPLWRRLEDAADGKAIRLDIKQLNEEDMDG